MNGVSEVVPDVVIQDTEICIIVGHVQNYIFTKNKTLPMIHSGAVTSSLSNLCHYKNSYQRGSFKSTAKLNSPLSFASVGEQCDVAKFSSASQKVCLAYFLRCCIGNIAFLTCFCLNQCHASKIIFGNYAITYNSMQNLSVIECRSSSEFCLHRFFPTYPEKWMVKLRMPSLTINRATEVRYIII